MRAVAILAAYNEERFIAACLEHLFGQGLEAYLIDNSSTDRTVEIAERYLGNGLIGIETHPRAEDVYRWRSLLERKEELAETLEADWFMHADPDEVRLPPRSDRTLAQAFAEVDEQGYNAVNFLEFTFVPTREAPDHDHPHFQQTMKWYYPFPRNFPARVTAWKRQDERVKLARSGGHRVRFENLLMYPEPFKMRHYLFLSVPHAISKYVSRKYDEAELKRGWHGWRAWLTEEKIELPSQAELHTYTSDDELNLSNPWIWHITDYWSLPREERGGLGGPKVAQQGAASRPRPWASGTSGKRVPILHNDVPIIVGGCFRSGTSLIRRMLDAHSRIHCAPEVKFFLDFHNDYLKDPLQHVRFMVSARRMLPKPQLLEVLGGTFVVLHEKAAERAGKSRWADKSPENVLYLKDWQKLLGDDWVFVHVVRNPLDTLASIKEVRFPLVIPSELDARIDLYKHYTQAGLDFGELHPDRYYRVIYERLVDRPEPEISSLMNWLGEDFEPVQLDFNSATHQKGLEDPKIRNTTTVHTASVGRWKDLLTPSEAEQVYRECGPLWRHISGDLDYGSELAHGSRPQSKGLLRRLWS